MSARSGISCGDVRRPILRYHGGKWKLAPWIISHFPPHKIYVEPYGGAASVLLRKPRVYAEVYNDMDGEVVNVFRVLRNYVQAAELERLLRLTPFARDEFQAAYEPSDDPVELARRTIVRSFMGFGSAAINTKHRTGFRGRSFRSGTSPANDWRNYPDAMRHYETRLQGVAIESRPALELIQAQDRADVLFYVDPPYPRDTRYGADCYRYEMNDDDHREMAEILRHAKGMVVVSGYSCPLYDEIFRGWRSVSTPWFADGARARTECLWISPNAIDNAGLLALAE